jgi:hypothetical protein
MSKYLTRTQIENADDTPYREVEVPEWADGEATTVRIKGLSGTEVDDYEASILKMKRGKPDVTLKNATARLVAWTLVDENNSRMFVNEAEVAVLGRKSSIALQRCFDVASKLSGLRPEDIEAMVEDFD